MSAIEEAGRRCSGLSVAAKNFVRTQKAKNNDFNLMDLLTPADGMNYLTQFQQSGANRQRYALFRGWVHAAIHALAQEGAGQPVQVGAIEKKKKKPPKGTKGANSAYRPQNYKHMVLPKSLRQKAELADGELEVYHDHDLVVSLERPNPIQHRWQFVYSYIANLCLTGFGFVVCGENEEGVMEYYSIPTTWVVPDHRDGAYSRFKIVNPNNPQNVTMDSDVWFTRDQMGFSYFPDPSDPMKALSLTQAQQMGIRIDDHIQTSQSAFFENGVFPSVVITVGQNPTGDGTPGQRPRLSPVQRRQVYAAIKKVSGGVANYGNPAIIDGLIEKIDRLSATQTEMGWEKSEQAVRTRILSAFGVHPFILGEAMPGSYAQAYLVEQRFCKRVNVFLEMLGWLITALSRAQLSDEDLMVWWTPTKPTDPSMDQQMWQQARTRGDVSQNEFRAWMDLPPDEDSNEAFIDKTALPQIVLVASNAANGTITPEQAKAILVGLGLPDKLSDDIAGEGPPPEPEMPEGEVDEFGNPLPTDESGMEETEPNETGLEKAARVLQQSIVFLNKTPSVVADEFLEELV